MKKIANFNGYDIFEMSKEECRKNGVVFPNLCAFPDYWCEEEDGKREWCKSDCDFENLEEAEKWCKSTYGLI